MLRERLEAVRQAQGGPEFRIGSYAVHPSHTRYPVLAFDSLYPGIINFAMPSIYTVDPRAVQTSIAADRGKMKDNDIIPWLQPGTQGEKPAAAQFRELLSCVLAGGMGVTYYTHHGFDAADFAAVARAILIVGKYESVFTQGTPVSAWSSAPDGFSICGRTLQDRAVWIVASDQPAPADTLLPSPQGMPGPVHEIQVKSGAVTEERTAAGPVRFDAGQTRVFTQLR